MNLEVRLALMDKMERKKGFNSVVSWHLQIVLKRFGRSAYLEE